MSSRQLRRTSVRCSRRWKNWFWNNWNCWKPRHEIGPYLEWHGRPLDWWVLFIISQFGWSLLHYKLECLCTYQCYPLGGGVGVEQGSCGKFLLSGFDRFWPGPLFPSPPLLGILNIPSRGGEIIGIIIDRACQEHILKMLHRIWSLKNCFFKLIFFVMCLWFQMCLCFHTEYSIWLPSLCSLCLRVSTVLLQSFLTRFLPR